MVRNRKLQKCLAAILSLTCAVPALPAVPAAAKTDISLDDYEDVISTYNIDDSISGYLKYREAHPGEDASATFTVEAGDFVSYTESDEDGEKKPTVLKDYDGQSGDSVRTEEKGKIEWEISVPETGYYYPSVLYYPIEGMSSAIERGFFIDGVLPYSELADVQFVRTFTCEVETTLTDERGVVVKNWAQDNQGNDMRPSMKETPEWISSYLYDSNGYVTEPLALYLEKGTHTLTMVSEREPMVIRQIDFTHIDKVKSYVDYKAEWDSKGATATSGAKIRIEAENADKTSSQMLYPIQDQSSPAVYPSSAKALRNNAIGGNSWRDVGQWIEYSFHVDNAGYYNLSLIDNQNFVRGIYVSRKITIDGEVPFAEFEDYGFVYGQSWRSETMSDAAGNPYDIYLSAGDHTIRFEVVLGDFSQIVSDMQNVVNQLNDIYRRVIRITGVAPDSFRDYSIGKNLPTLAAECAAVKVQLDDILARLRAVAGKGSDKETVLKTMSDQLGQLSKDVEFFTRVLGTFKINVRACGNWITQVLPQPLALDTIYLVSPKTKVTVENNAWYNKVGYEFKRLFYSFIIDYNQVGNVAADTAGKKPLTLWIGTGRDQANVIKGLIDETFTAKTGINVNVMLIDMSTLLQATLAGQGPDVAIQVANDLPMNYGIRNAVMDLSGFADLPEVKERFHESALKAFEFNGKTYALPETQTFPMMFYRKDILKEIDLDIDTLSTWDGVKVALAKLNVNQMDIAMLPNEQVFAMLLYQNGGVYYNADGSASALDSDEGVNAFKEYCAFYTDYKLDKETSDVERFRTGEAPIMIADYGMYNNLQVSAPDIKGLWGMVSVPGTVKEDGSIDRSTGCTGTATVIMKSAKNPGDAWEFIKWWTDAQTQILYGREMESLMGASARVASANKEAFRAMNWPTADLEALLDQFERVKGIPQVPGGYFTWRNVNNAFYSVTTKTDTISPREELMDKVILINDEIDAKRDEFNLPVNPD